MATMRAAGAVAVVLAAAVGGQGVAAQAWKTAGNMVVGSNRHAAVALTNGLVLLMGGFDGASFLTRAELFNPATLQWTLTGAMAAAREDHTATVLPSGAVLVAGGLADFTNLDSCEIYNSATGTWSSTGAMITPRAQHTASPVGEGSGYRVLVAGGEDGSFTATRSSELYDPATSTWTNTGLLQLGRYEHAAVSLKDGRVLVAGGYDVNGDATDTAELYTVGTGGWTLLTSVMSTPRTLHAATILPDGFVLVSGGQNTLGVYQASADLFDPATSEWTVAGNMVNQRGFHTLTLLPSGNVMTVGGQNLGGFPTTLNSAELYVSALRIWQSTASIQDGRTRHSATLMTNGEVIVAGGQIQSNNNILNSAAVFVPSPLATPTQAPSATPVPEVTLAANTPAAIAVLVIFAVIIVLLGTILVLLLRRRAAAAGADAASYAKLTDSGATGSATTPKAYGTV